MRSGAKKIGTALAILAGILLLAVGVIWITFAPENGGDCLYINDPVTKYKYCIVGEEVHIVDCDDVKVENGYLELPDSFWGKPVTMVDLRGIPYAERVHIPDSVTNVQHLRGSSLREVTGGVNVEVLGEGVFFECRKLIKVEFIANDSITMIPANAFDGCTALESVELGASIASIESGAFDETPWAETPEGQATIEKYGKEKD